MTAPAASVEARIKALIRAQGPISVATYMAEALTGGPDSYYTSRDPFGAGGDFTTAPEISQLFGEILGLTVLDWWLRASAPARFTLAELGPGRGALMADVWRAASLRSAFTRAAEVRLLEASPVLRSRQTEALARVGVTPVFVENLAQIPGEGPLILLANEFFDALPVRQFQRCGASWHERMIALEGKAFRCALSPRVSEHGALPTDAPEGAIFEINVAARAMAAELGRLLQVQGGMALIVDYGHVESGYGDTFQALRAHRFADPLVAPGTADLTAHVDFAALAAAARSGGAVVHGPVTQGAFLEHNGINLRAARLAERNPNHATAITAALERLVSPAQMGTLFKVMAFTGPGGPAPSGFGP